MKFGVIEIWRASLDITPDRQAFLAELLSPDERERAFRYRFDADRRRSIAARGTLRELLARCWGAPPADLQFTYGARGKPVLLAPPGEAPLFFNVSHSDDVAFYAITRIGPVGIDVERIRPDFATDKIAARFFAPEEIAILSALPALARNARFFRFWTRKEAYCKCLGDGFALDPKRMDASASPLSSADWFSLNWDGLPDARTVLCDLKADTGYAAALAIEGAPTPVVLQRWGKR